MVSMIGLASNYSRASIDGCTFDVQEPFDDDGEQNALYDGYTCSVVLSYIFVWAPDGTMVYCKGLKHSPALTVQAICLEVGTMQCSQSTFSTC
jgi:hypothetical protein